MRSALDYSIPPPPPSPPFKAPASQDSGDHYRSTSTSYSPSLLIIAAIVAFVIVASGGIHLLLRFLFRRSSGGAVLPQTVHRRTSSVSSTSSAAPPSPADRGLIESLPLFSLASSLAALPKSSPDCAVCLSAFRPHDELRLLPACRHAFHASCIDTWLRSTPSCPLCRSPVVLPSPLVAPHPPPQTAPQEPRSGSFRVEIGSVSRRRSATEEEDLATPPPGPLPPPPHHRRSYSLGSSFEYVVEEEVEAVLARVLRRRPESKDKVEVEADDSAVPPPPGAEVAEAAGGGSRRWLREYVDRLASSASSSFNSLRYSGRWSHRFDGGGGGRDSWDFELEESGFSNLYRWLWGT